MSTARSRHEQPPATSEERDDDTKREEAAELARLEQERADDEGMIVDLVADVQNPTRLRKGDSDA